MSLKTISSQSKRLTRIRSILQGGVKGGCFILSSNAWNSNRIKRGCKSNIVSFFVVTYITVVVWCKITFWMYISDFHILWSTPHIINYLVNTIIFAVCIINIFKNDFVIGKHIIRSKEFKIICLHLIAFEDSLKTFWRILETFCSTK